MSDIFREVDEALQQEKIENIWKEYRTTIIACLVIFIVGTALTKMYYAWDRKHDGIETARLISALDSDSPQTALQAVINDTRKGHRALGIMSAASLYMNNDEPAKAAELYKQAAESRKTPRDIRDLARILYVQNASDGSIDILKPLLANEKSPWIWHARLEAAVLSAHNGADYKSAIAYLEPFEQTNAVPLSLKQRALALQHIYGLKQAEAKPAAETTKDTK